VIRIPRSHQRDPKLKLLICTRWGRAVKRPIPIYFKQIEEEIEVETLEGVMSGHPGDYLVMGIEGELYIINKEIFIKSYEIIS
jgi:hypothetical protein